MSNKNPYIYYIHYTTIDKTLKKNKTADENQPYWNQYDLNIKRKNFVINSTYNYTYYLRKGLLMLRAIQ